MKNNKNKYLVEAENFYNKAVAEFNRASSSSVVADIYVGKLFRDSAEKAWNAVVKTTDYIIQKIENTKVKSHGLRREKLFSIESKNGNIRKYKFYERFMARCHFLHELCFYEGIYTEEELKDNIKKVKNYIKDAKKI